MKIANKHHMALQYSNSNKNAKLLNEIYLLRLKLHPEHALTPRDIDDARTVLRMAHKYIYDTYPTRYKDKGKKSG